MGGASSHTGQAAEHGVATMNTSTRPSLFFSPLYSTVFVTEP